MDKIKSLTAAANTHPSFRMYERVQVYSRSVSEPDHIIGWTPVTRWVTLQNGTKIIIGLIN